MNTVLTESERSALVNKINSVTKKEMVKPADASLTARYLALWNEVYGSFYSNERVDKSIEKEMRLIEYATQLDYYVCDFSSFKGVRTERTYKADYDDAGGFLFRVTEYKKDFPQLSNDLLWFLMFYWYPYISGKYIAKSSAEVSAALQSLPEHDRKFFITNLDPAVADKLAAL